MLEIQTDEIESLCECRSLPDYAVTLMARHEAHRDTFKEIVNTLHLQRTGRVLDVGVGDGFFSGLFLQRLGPSGCVDGLDISSDFLDLAGSTYADSARFRGVEGDACDMDLPSNSYDLVWCAHSFRSFPDPTAALREIVRVTRPGGYVAVLENDRLHQAVLPWPSELELAVFKAEQDARRSGPEPAERLEIARHLLRYFKDAGLTDVSKRTWTTDRWQTLSRSDRFYLLRLFGEHWQRIEPHLDEESRDRVEPYLADGHADSFVRQADLEVTFSDALVVGRKDF